MGTITDDMLIDSIIFAWLQGNPEMASRMHQNLVDYRRRGGTVGKALRQLIIDGDLEILHEELENGEDAFRIVPTEKGKAALARMGNG